MFCNFCEKFKNFKWPPILARQKFFVNWDYYSADRINNYAELLCGSKISSKSSILHSFQDTSIFVFCNFCEKFENSKWLPFLENFFLKIGLPSLQRYLVGKKFRQNHSISHGFRDTSLFAFCNFAKNSKNSKWLPFLDRQIICEILFHYLVEMPRGSQISSKSLYLAQFSR